MSAETVMTESPCIALRTPSGVLLQERWRMASQNRVCHLTRPSHSLNEILEFILRMVLLRRGDCADFLLVCAQTSPTYLLKMISICQLTYAASWILTISWLHDWNNLKSLQIIFETYVHLIIINTLTNKHSWQTLFDINACQTYDRLWDRVWWF